MTEPWMIENLGPRDVKERLPGRSLYAGMLIAAIVALASRFVAYQRSLSLILASASNRFLRIAIASGGPKIRTQEVTEAGMPAAFVVARTVVLVVLFILGPKLLNNAPIHPPF